MSTDGDNFANNIGSTIDLSDINCDSNDKDSGNIIIEVSDISSLENEQIKTEISENIASEEVPDRPDLVNVRPCTKDQNAENSSDNVDTDSVVLCETLYESEASSDYLIDNTGQFPAQVEEPKEDMNILEDIPNEVLVYTCQPETTDNLDKYLCKSCGMVTGCIFCLKSHYESIHLSLGLIQYRCDQTSYLKNYTEICHKCNLVCESKQEMFDHRKIHFVSCDVCDMSFDSALFLSNHCKTAHEKFEVIISCDLCEQWFKQLQDLSDHYQEYHDMILCIVCFKRFSNVPDLIKHHGTHKIILTDDKNVLPYACSKCNQGFAEISDLSTHLVRDHPNRKAAYGTISRKTPSVKVKHRKKDNVKFDDCGGLSQEDVADLDDDCTSTNTKKLKKNHSLM